MDKRTTLSEVDRIAVISDPVLRNLQITRSYHALSLEFSKRSGACANWCTFATWASRQAGQSIRQEDLAKALENWLAADPALIQAMYDLAKGVLDRGAQLDKKGIVKLVWETVNLPAIMHRASEAVARGNQKVYAEIGRAFARFLETCIHDDAFDAQQIVRFCNTLQPGDPPDGQRYLKQAFERYYRAFFEPDQKKKAELMLLANIEIGFHEQTRLQPEIAEALEASVLAPAQFKEKLITTLFPNQSWIISLGTMFSSLFHRPTPLDIAIGKFVPLLRLRIRLFLTAHLMELDFPNRSLHLGQDLHTRFPPDLAQLSNAELIDFLKNIDPTPDSLQETGATDWANLQDRLHFIADLFRCYQEAPDLWLPPFEDDSV